MHTWVLIITLVIGSDYSREGTAMSVHSVGGFTSVQSCLNAGNAWLQDTRKVHFQYNRTIARATCVKK